MLQKAQIIKLKDENLKLKGEILTLKENNLKTKLHLQFAQQRAQQRAQFSRMRQVVENPSRLAQQRADEFLKSLSIEPLFFEDKNPTSPSMFPPEPTFNAQTPIVQSASAPEYIPL